MEFSSFLPSGKHCLCLALLIIMATPILCVPTTDKFYVIAHMANNRESLNWAVRNGANAIENDIQFDSSGKPTIFQHGGMCDCTCSVFVPRIDHICFGALGLSCTASEDAASHLGYIAGLKQIALVIMDSKVDASWGERLRTAGANVVKLLEESLFKKGYQGNVVISAGKINCFDYVYMAALEASKTPNKNSYYFAFDQEGDNYEDVAAMLSRFSRNRVFGTGISACGSEDFEDGISKAVTGVSNKEVGMSYIWTLDADASMLSYINMGVQGVLTNRVAALREVARKAGLVLAVAGDKISVSSTPRSSPNKCDCDYHPGGCVISFPPPSGKACKCKYALFWTCSGQVVACAKSTDSCCTNSDASKNCCKYGKGDCDGYP